MNEWYVRRTLVLRRTYIVEDDVGQPDKLRREVQTAYPVEISWVPLQELVVPRRASSKTRQRSFRLFVTILDPTRRS